MIGNRDKKIIKTFGNNLKTIRLKKKLSLRKLADAADMDFGNIRRIEKGMINPTLTTIMALAEALGVDPCQLINGK